MHDGVERWSRCTHCTDGSAGTCFLVWEGKSNVKIGADVGKAQRRGQHRWAFVVTVQHRTNWSQVNE